jgi:hypothetical protein
LLFFRGVKKSGTSEVLIDLLVPAHFASRYRAAVTSISPLEAELRFPFCPRVFSSGVVLSCPATLSLVRGPHVIGSRGILWIGHESNRATARFQFEKPLSTAQVALVQSACIPAGVLLPMVLEQAPLAVAAAGSR